MRPAERRHLCEPRLPLTWTPAPRRRCCLPGHTAQPWAFSAPGASGVHSESGSQPVLYLLELEFHKGRYSGRSSCHPAAEGMFREVASCFLCGTEGRLVRPPGTNDVGSPKKCTFSFRRSAVLPCTHPCRLRGQSSFRIPCARRCAAPEVLPSAFGVTCGRGAGEDWACLCGRMGWGGRAGQDSASRSGSNPNLGTWWRWPRASHEMCLSLVF